MFILHIEHPVMRFEDWKKAFDNDPVDRRKSGVRSYRVLRPVDDDKYVMIDLEFDNQTEAEAMLTDLRILWGNVQGKIMMDPKTRIVEVVDSKEL